MNLQTPSGQHDERSLVYNTFFQDIDSGFLGVDERTPVFNLPSGVVASAKNKRFRNGRATDRAGIALCRWLKGDGTTPFNEIYGGVIYSDPTGLVEWILIAADGGVWKTRPGNVATRVPLPPGILLTAESFAQFVQCMNVVVLLRGPNYAPLALANLDAGFQQILQTPAGIAANTGNYRFGMQFFDNVTYLLCCNGGSAYYTAAALPLNQWVHVAMVFNCDQFQRWRFVGLRHDAVGRIRAASANPDQWPK